MNLEMRNQQKREKYQEAGYDDFCEACQIPYNGECPECPKATPSKDIPQDREPVYRWVKATERLPTDLERKAARKGREFMGLKMNTEGWITVGAFTCYTPYILQEWFSGIEWLEEIPAPAQPGIDREDAGEIPEEIHEWIDSVIFTAWPHVYDDDLHAFQVDGNRFKAKTCLIAMYRKLQEEIAQVVENATEFSRLSVKLTNENAALQASLSSMKAERDEVLKYLEECKIVLERAEMTGVAFVRAKTILEKYGK